MSLIGSAKQQLLEQRVAEIDQEIGQLRALKRELQSMERLECPDRVWFFAVAL
jgi:hypothetical protein